MVTEMRCNRKRLRNAAETGDILRPIRSMKKAAVDVSIKPNVPL